MHTFQPYPFDVIELNPFTKFGEDWGALTSEYGGKINAMTISWGGVGELWGKHVATVYVRESRYTKELMDSGEYFSITFFEPHYKNWLKYLGAVSGRQEDKIAGARLTINRHKEVPFIDDGNFVIICKKLSCTQIGPDDILDPAILDAHYKDGDYHYMFVGEILELLAR
ncbi:MAG: flavin reductase [Lachnospiraceae bacterium]|nr:flavin reductase [Lachnospiraceae bacterium]